MNNFVPSENLEGVIEHEPEFREFDLCVEITSRVITVVHRIIFIILYYYNRFRGVLFEL